MSDTPEPTPVVTKTAYVPGVSRHDVNHAVRDADGYGVNLDVLVNDLLDSVALAMSHEGIPTETAQSVIDTANDYVTNAWY